MPHKEIELKAHVKNRSITIEKIDSFANRESHVIKDDEYWGNGGNKIRIRKEKRDDLCTTLITYKKKESRIFPDGKALEVNDEFECQVSDPTPLEEFLKDNGFSVKLKKHKDVTSWTYTFTPEGLSEKVNATLELCTVPPLGDFLELEVLSENDDENFVSKVRAALIKILNKAGISEDEIENRYYSEMLGERK